MDFATLNKIAPSQFEDAAKSYGAASEMAAQAKGETSNQIASGLRKKLNGKAVDAAVKQLESLSENFNYVQVECGLVRTSLNALAADLRAAKDKLKAAVSDAESQKFTVNSDGSVSYPEGGEEVDGRRPSGGTVSGRDTSSDRSGPIDPGSTSKDASNAVRQQAENLHPNPNHGPAVACADRIATAVQEATEADEKWAPKIRQLKADDDLTVSAADWVDANKDRSRVRSGAEDYLDSIKSPPEDGTAKENAQWWNGLSEKERAAYLSVRPASIGGMDGIPVDVRDDANRTVLNEQRAKYELEYAAMPKEPNRYMPNPGDSYPAVVETERWKSWSDRKEYLEKQLKAIDQIEDPFKGVPIPEHKKLHLLKFDGEGDGRAIVALGNPDKADHTAILVPGTDTTVDGLEGQINRIDRIQDVAMNQAAPGESVSTISWLGYDAPEKDLSVSTAGRAEDAAPQLRSFSEGLRQTHEGERGHLTIMGHSYGSTTLGAAASGGEGVKADDVIAVGSPGMTVEHAKDLQMDPDHVWAGATQQDRIVRFTSGLTLGENPASEGFGAQPMEVNEGRHSSYWDEGGESLRNQGRIIVGKEPTIGPYYGRGTSVDLSPGGRTPIID